MGFCMLCSMPIRHIWSWLPSPLLKITRCIPKPFWFTYYLFHFLKAYGWYGVATMYVMLYFFSNPSKSLLQKLLHLWLINSLGVLNLLNINSFKNFTILMGITSTHLNIQSTATRIYLFLKYGKWGPIKLIPHT